MGTTNHQRPEREAQPARASRDELGQRDDASHVSREYKRFFGAPPMRDIERLRGVAMESTSL
jgi:hypothetical protein